MSSLLEIFADLVQVFRGNYRFLKYPLSGPDFFKNRQQITQYLEKQNKVETVGEYYWEAMTANAPDDVIKEIGQRIIDLSDEKYAYEKFGVKV